MKLHPEKTENHLSEIQAGEYVDALLQDELGSVPEFVIEHVESCQECKLRVMEVQDFLLQEGLAVSASTSMPQIGSVQTETDLDQHYPIWRMAAAIILLLSGALAFYIMSGTENTNDQIADSGNNSNELQSEVEHHPEIADAEMVNGQDDESGIETELLFAANFEPNTLLDAMVGDVVRAAVIDSVRFPQVGSTITGAPRFEWSSNPGQTLYLAIMNNKGQTVFETEVTDQSYSHGEALEPGLYYWKIQTDKDLVYMGKFSQH